MAPRPLPNPSVPLVDALRRIDPDWYAYFKIRDLAAESREVISPAQLTGDVNDWAPIDATTGRALAACRTVRFSTSAAWNITGLSAAGIVQGQRITLMNIGGFTGTLKALSGASAAANQLALSADIVLAGLQSATLERDTISSLWRPIDR